ncbi:MAG: Prolipoprotein diacylglyceryl transferase [Candidatus Uhrbacteria bacterium GW2011_GWF2_44_350]|uniref:Phosphatidylglycerol--prolipoprotein diacylglyceryl transferase n=1 Tax=Candidatus Uhrbacteria bacterium GW2011_GWF2_44_350 TaxID=1619000 RepID=A0A0G1JKI4_9BACT|nr:MAG: Prolipoprotein diacylglyceryl transferase [Candidatus Uhrbacteria bacterium GW2011_GWF2_44_350]
MLPYITSTVIPLGPITIQTWGLLVSLGFVAGGAASAWLCRARGLKSEIVWEILGLLLLGSMVFGRLFFVLFYSPGYFIEHPLEVFYIWQGGMSMMGGIFGAVLLGLIYLRQKKLGIWRYSDTLIFGLPLGYFIGRIGCFLIHDHPGLPTNFFLGVQYPDGVVRHDLGLYHSLFGLILFLVFLVFKKIKAPIGTFLVSFLLVYGLFRLAFDFLRVGETVLIYLTPGQWSGIIMVAFGLYFWFFRLSCG